jgi:hypothetical protein
MHSSTPQPHGSEVTMQQLCWQQADAYLGVSSFFISSFFGGMLSLLKTTDLLDHPKCGEGCC